MEENSTKKKRSFLDIIEERRGLWGLLSLILGLIIGVGGTLTTQQLLQDNSETNVVENNSTQIKDLNNVSNSAIGSNNIVIANENSHDVENTIIQSPQNVSFSEFSRAIARLDYQTLSQYEKTKGFKKSDYKMAFEENIGGDKYVIKELISNANSNDQTINWLTSLFEKGFDVNSKIKLGEAPSTSLFWLAVDAKDINLAIFLLEQGASPHSWHLISDELSKYPRMAWPIEFVLQNRHLSKTQKKELIEKLIESGAKIANVEGIREEIDLLGVSTKKHKSICEIKCEYGNEICSIISKFNKSYNFKYYRNSSSFFYPESYFIGNDGNVYLKTKGFGYPNSKYVDPYTLMVLRISPKQDRTVLYSYDYERCSYQSGKYTFRRNCWTSRYVDTDFDTGQINQYVEAKPICSNKN